MNCSQVSLTYCFRPSVPQVCIGHQYLFLHKDFEFPRVGKLKCGITEILYQVDCYRSTRTIGSFLFRVMKDDDKCHIRVVPPLLRREVFII